MRTVFITPELNNNKFGEIQSSVRENYFKYFEKLNFYCNSNFTLKKKIIEEIAKNLLCINFEWRVIFSNIIRKN